MSEDYVFLYRFKELPYLISDFFMQAYSKRKPRYCYVKGYWYCYLKKEMYNAALDEGLESIKDPKWLSKFESEFNNLLSQSPEYFKIIESKQELSKSEIKEFFKYLTNLLKYYSHLDQFFTDKVFAESIKDPSLKPKVEKLGEMKNYYREKLNELAINPESLLKKYLQKISQSKDLPFETLYLYSQEEIYKIFDGFTLSNDEIQKRSSKYAMYFDGDKFHYLSDNNADKIIEEIHTEPESHEILKGIAANKGKVTAKARILEYTLEDFGNLAPLIAEMQKGEVLITETTGPEIMAACSKAAAIVTDEGGLLSHAAIVSRELGIPCIVGTKFATTMIKTGDLIEVNANHGVVRVLERSSKSEGN